MAAGTLLSRLTGFGRVAALSYAFGATRLADAYNLANTTPNIIYDLVVGGVLSASLIPVFVDHLTQDDEDSAWHAISAIATITIVVLVVLSALFALAAPVIIRVYLVANHTASSGDQRAIATTLLRWFAPQVLLLGVITVTQALLNVRRRFANPAFTPVANNLLTIAVLLLFPHLVHDLRLASLHHDQRALAWLGLGTTLGYVVQAGLQVPPLRRAGIHLRVVWAPTHAAVRSVVRLSGWLIGVVAANQAALVVILVLANRRGGDFSAYQYAYQFFLLPHAIFAVSVGTAITPDLAEQWSRQRVDVFRDRLSQGIRMTLLVLIPAAVGYLLLARPIIGVALQHGHMTMAQADRTAATLAAFAVGLPGFSAYLLLMRAYQSMKNTRAMFGMYVLENGTNVVIALAVYRRFGVVGLAAAWSIAYTVTACIAFARLRTTLGGIDGRAIAASSARITTAAGAMAVIVYGLHRAMGGGVIGLGVAVVAGATVYVGAARLLGVEELASLVHIRRREA